MKESSYFNPDPGFVQSLRNSRAKFLEKIEGGIAIVVSAQVPEASLESRNGYRQESNFFYLTGLAEAGSVAVFTPGHPTEKSVLFLAERDPLMELWTGPMLGTAGAVAKLGFDAAYDISQLRRKLSEFLQHADSIFWDAEPSRAFSGTVKEVVSGSRLRKQGAQVHDPTLLIADLRLFKSEWEIEQIAQANKVTALAFEAAMRRTRPGLTEYQIQATLEFQMKEQGARSLGYPAIVASGSNSCCLHYSQNNAVLVSGDLLLIDAGCEWNAYTADVTRTFPVNGRFSEEQKVLYEAVLGAQEAAIAAIRPGVTLSELNSLAGDMLARSLVEAGVLPYSLAEVLDRNLHKDFFPHGLSHWLGLDVHDAGRYRIKNLERPLEEGMCLTVEPGLYVQLSQKGVEERWKGIGIRIEDDLLVTANGHRNLTTCIKSVADVECASSV